MDNTIPNNIGPKKRNNLMKKYLDFWQNHNFRETEYSLKDKTDFEEACKKWIGREVILKADIRQDKNFQVVRDIDLRRKEQHRFGCFMIIPKEEFIEYGYRFSKWVLISEVVFPGGF